MDATRRGEIAFFLSMIRMGWNHYTKDIGIDPVRMIEEAALDLHRAQAKLQEAKERAEFVTASTQGLFEKHFGEKAPSSKEVRQYIDELSREGKRLWKERQTK